MGSNETMNNLVLCAIGLATECSIENFGCIYYHADVDSNALFTLFEDKAQQKFFKSMKGRVHSWME
jgi:phage pi2 protein 07